jgi:hypothetical protein
MNIRSRKAWMGLLGAALVVSAATGVTAARADDPPEAAWYDGDNVAVADPLRVADLVLRDAAGDPVTSGSVTADPFVAYASSATPLREGDGFATLFVHTPQATTNQGAWPGQQLSATTAYPAPGAPGALAGAAYLKGSAAGDQSLADYIAAFENTSSTDGLAGVYEIRLRTSSPTAGVGDSYASTFVKVTGSTWSVTTPPVLGETDPQPTQTTATVPATVAQGTPFSVVVSVTGTAGSGGTVTVTDGATPLATGAVSAGGSATLPIGGTQLTPGAHTLTIAYGGTAQAQPSSTTRTVTVTAATPAPPAASTTTLVAPRTARKSKKVKVTVTVSPAATGTVTIYDKGKALKQVPLGAGGTVSVKLPKLKAGKHKLTAAYGGSATVSPSTSAAVKVKVS